MRDLGCAGAIVGRAIYEGTLDLREAVAALASADAAKRSGQWPPAGSASFLWASITFSATCAGTSS